MITIDDIATRQAAIFRSLAIRRADLARYAFTINALHAFDVSREFTYQRTFNGLYMVRRGHVQHLADVFTNPAQLAATIGASRARVELATFARRIG